MSRRVEYLHYPAGVRVTTKPDARGYRIRFNKPDGTPSEARRTSWDEANQLAQELAGMLGRGQTSAPNGDATIRMLAEDFLVPENHRHRPSATYMRSSRSVVGRHIIPVIGHYPCGQWDRAVSQMVVDHCQKEGLADSTVAGYIRTLGGIAKMGRERGFLDPTADPTAGLVRHKDGRVDLAELPDSADIGKVAIAIEELTGDPRRALQVWCATYSGLRIGEILGLKVGDIDLAEGTIRVERQMCAATSTLIPPKYDSRRTTIFPAFLDDDYAAAVAGRDPDRPMFPAARGDHERYSTFLNQRWNPALHRAGWPRNVSGRGWRWRFHDLRHYFCTWALSKDGLDLDVADVAKFAGHKSPQVTWEVYVASRPDRADRARLASRHAAR